MKLRLFAVSLLLAAGSADAATLTVTIDNIRVQDGQLRRALYDSAAGHRHLEVAGERQQHLEECRREVAPTGGRIA
jgi:uncharacterized protein (DUF2141 family)